MSSMQMRLIAGVVTYWPNLELLRRLVQVLAATTDGVIIFANSPLEEREYKRLKRLSGKGNIEIFQSSKNVGVGFAYNYILKRAQAMGVYGAFLFDQDSQLCPETLHQLTAAACQLSSKGHRVAVVGPRPIGPRLQSAEFKSVRLFARPQSSSPARIMATDFVISSGSLVILSAFETVGPFRDDFFIDGVDIEWCFRAWKKGFSCWIVLDAAMEHRLGRGTIIVPVFGISIPIQPPSRLYTYVRNQVHMLSMAHVPLRWKLKIIPYISLQAVVYALSSRSRRASLVAIGRGVREGLRRMRRQTA